MLFTIIKHLLNQKIIIVSNNNVTEIIHQNMYVTNYF